MMRALRQSGRSAAGWFIWLALIAFAIQPASAAAMAASMDAGSIKVVVCSQHDGARAVTVDFPAPPTEKAPCEKCPACTLAVAANLSAPLRIERAAYLERAAIWSTTDTEQLPPARAPPRPPSQGPPILEA